MYVRSSGRALGPLLIVLAALAGCSGQGPPTGGNGASGVRSTWTAAATRDLVAAIRRANRHGLDPADYLAGIGDAPTPAALNRAALAYAAALAHGRADPRRLHRIYEIDRPDPDLAAGLQRALQENKVGDWLESLAPRDEAYRALADAYAAATARAHGTRPPLVPAGSDLRPGGADPRLPAIAAALAANGYVQAPPAAPRRYTPDLVDAVRQLQEDYGLTKDGVIDAATLAALNEGPFERARTLAVALERLRWLPRDPPATRIDVNTAATALTYWRDGRAVDARRTVAGEPGRETPQLASPLFRLVASPTWTIPRSIQGEATRHGAGYLRRNHMSWKDGWLIQASGPRNSLGMVKFDLQNDHAIYLHDTPAKALFGQDERHSSHGCVRVFDALGFAEMIARDEGVLDEWHRARATGRESFVRLPRQIPVRLLYHTAFVDGGRVRYRLDAYGWDEDVAEALGLPHRARPQHVPREGDLGP